VYIKTKTSVLDGMLKVGGLLGFLKIFSALLSWAHMMMFKRALSKDLEADPTSDPDTERT
jgi:hypothetical protein